MGSRKRRQPLASPSVSPSPHFSLPPFSSSLGHWGEWAAILILIPLSVCGRRAERGEPSPGIWNARSFFSSGHRTESEGRPDGRERKTGKRESEEARMKEHNGRAGVTAAVNQEIIAGRTLQVYLTGSPGGVKKLV